MILKSRARDLLAVEEVLWADETDDRIDQQWLEAARHGISARLQCLLIHAVVCVGRQRAALPGLEIHHVVAERTAAKRQCGVSRLCEQREVDAEIPVRGFRSGDRLKDEIDRRP